MRNVSAYKQYSWYHKSIFLTLIGFNSHKNSLKNFQNMNKYIHVYSHFNCKIQEIHKKKYLWTIKKYNIFQFSILVKYFNYTKMQKCKKKNNNNNPVLKKLLKWIIKTVANKKSYMTQSETKRIKCFHKLAS